VAATGIRTRGFDIKVGAKHRAADKAARAEAQAVIERAACLGRERMLWSPTIRAALIAGTPWLVSTAPGCRTSRASIFLSIVILASVATLVLGLVLMVDRRLCRGSSGCAHRDQRRSVA
jgi:hypothetical protein